MGWTPSSGRRTPGAADQAPPPTPPRRRRRAAAPEEPSDTPNLDQAVAANPRHSTGLKPAGGAPPGIDDRYRTSVRLGKRWTEIVVAIRRGDYTWTEFCEGLDEEELARGQLRSGDGGFKGRPPKLVPREFLLACQREHKRRFEELFSKDVLEVARQYLQMAKAADLKPETKAKMLQYAMERVFGAIPKEHKITQEAPWEQMIVNVMRDGNDAVPDYLSRRYAGYRERQGATEEEPTEA